MPAITTLINWILQAFGMAVKHPVFQKIAFFAVFISLLTFVMDYFVSKLDFSLISSFYFYEIASYLGLISALSIFIKLIISVYFARQFVSYFRN